MFKKLCGVMALVVTVSGCSTMGAMQKSEWGSLIGAVGGAALGATLAPQGTELLLGMVGAGVGSLAGGLIGKRLDERDKELLRQAAAEALNGDVGTAASWENPESGNSGRLTVASVANAGGKTCRTLDVAAAVGGDTLQETQKWCLRGSDGWDFVETI